MTKSKRRTKPNGIILDDKFKIFYLDDNNLELQELVPYKDKDNETKYEWRGRGYYNSIPGAVKKYCRLKQNRCKSLDELISTMEDLDTRINNIFNFKSKSCSCIGSK
jgi:hypothetical protein